MLDWRNLPPLTALRAFCALGETGTAQAAGARLGVSHAAVSQQIKALEAHMGVTLVRRAGRGLELTGEGRRLAEALNRGFGEIERTVQDLTGQSDERPLQITLTPTFAANWLLPRLPRFRAGHAQGEIMMNASPRVVPFEAGGIDLAIRYGAGGWPGVEAELVLPTDIVVVAAPELVEGCSIETPEDLRAFHWLVEEGLGEVDAWLAQHGIGGALPSATYLAGNMMLDAARQGQGVVCTARLFVREDIAAGRLQLLFEEAAEERTGYHLVYPKGAVLRPVAKSFAKWLRREASQHS